MAHKAQPNTSKILELTYKYVHLQDDYHLQYVTALHVRQFFKNCFQEVELIEDMEKKRTAPGLLGRAPPTPSMIKSMVCKVTIRRAETSLPGWAVSYCA